MFSNFVLHGVLEVNADAHEENQEEQKKKVHWWDANPETDDEVAEHGGEPKHLDSRHRLRGAGMQSRTRFQMLR